MEPLSHLILLAGQPCSGKSTIMDELASGDARSIAEVVGLSTTQDWSYLTALEYSSACDADRLVLHYDTLRLWHRRAIDPHGFKQDAPLGAIARAKRVTVITLQCDTAVLRWRVLQRLIIRGSQLVRERRWNCVKLFLVRMMRLLVLYTTSVADEFDDAWLEYITLHPDVEHWCVNTTADGRVPLRVTI